MRIQIINGPNLNLLGVREPEIYGKKGFEEFLHVLRNSYHDVCIDYYQSNVEGELINKIHEVGFDLDAIKSVNTPVIEVHISNVHQREEYRHHSVISSVCKGVICGFGLDSYRLAIEALIHAK